jgi:hypothetical protein
MAHISRPFQVVLVAFVLLVGVWLFALRPHSGGSSAGSASAGSTPPATVSTPARSPAAPTPVIHGTAPGVEGLGRAINKAHGAVATSEADAKQLEERSAQASGESSAQASGQSSTPASSHAASSPTTSEAPGAAVSHSRAGSSAAGAAGTSTGGGRSAARTRPSLPAMQMHVEKALTQGKIAVILFWNPHGAEDSAVHQQAAKLGSGVAVFYAGAGMVGQFGTITRGVQIDETPTLLIVNKKGLAKTLTGFVDAYAIQQAIGEVRHA